MPDLEDTADLLNTSILVVAYDEYTVCVKASLNNLETTMNVSPISTTRIHKDHPKDQIIRDINSATQTRRMTKISEELAMPKDKYVADILKKFDFSLVKTASTPIETNKVLLNDEEAKDVFQVTPKTSHLHAVKRIFRYLKGQPKLGLWYPRDSPFDLEAFLIVIMLELALTENPQQEFVDQHNMVACLERTKENAEFHQIVDFLTTSSIHYTLTQIHSIVDGKTVVISKSSVRSNLHFNDEDGITCMLRNLDPTFKKFLMYPRFLQLFLNNQIALAEPFNDVYVTPVHDKKVFTNMKRQNKDFSGIISPLFASMLVPQVVEGEGSGQPSELQPPSSTAPPSLEEQVTTIASQPQKTYTPRRAKRGQDTKIPQSSGPPKKVGDEAVYTGEDDRVVRVATTATSLEAE
ncbi:hypothetical protein Tco_0112037 [Tanacetum coccineum]